MKIKRYYAPDMRRAIKRVREELGADAVILSSTSVADGVELVAAADFDETLLGKPKAQPMQKSRVVSSVKEHPLRVSPERHSADAGNVEKVSFRKAPAPAQTKEQDLPSNFRKPGFNGSTPGDSNPVLEEIKAEIQVMQALLREQADKETWEKLNASKPLQAQLIRRLCDIGIHVEIARKVVSGASKSKDAEKAWHDALVGVSQCFTPSHENLLMQGGVAALIGRSGVGKTTLLVKLAARFSMKYGADSVAMICADNYRVGARVQLQTFGQIMGVAVYGVKGGKSLLKTLQALRRKKLVLIDTPAVGLGKVRFGQLKKMLDLVPGVRKILVESAVTQPQAMQAAFSQFSELGIAALALTKIDESVSLGDCLSSVIRSRLPLAFVSNGPRVPEDLELARPARLVVRALGVARKFGQSIEMPRVTKTGRLLGVVNS